MLTIRARAPARYAFYAGLMFRTNMTPETNRCQSECMINWLTNDPALAKQFKAADRRFERGKRLAASLPLAEKIAAHRELKAKREAEYQRIMEGSSREAD